MEDRWVWSFIGVAIVLFIAGLVPLVREMYFAPAYPYQLRPKIVSFPLWGYSLFALGGCSEALAIWRLISLERKRQQSSVLSSNLMMTIFSSPTDRDRPSRVSPNKEE